MYGGPRPAVLLPRPVPAAGGGLQRARGRPAPACPVTIVMFLLSKRFGALADRHGPRFFMGVGPLVAAVGMACFLRLDADVDYLTDLLPGLLVFGARAVDDGRAAHGDGAGRRGRAATPGIASGVNNAIARVAGLVAIAGGGGGRGRRRSARRLDDELGDAGRRGPRWPRPSRRRKKQPLADVSRCRSAPAGRPARAGERRRPRPRRSRRSGCGIAIATGAGRAGRRARTGRDHQSAAPGRRATARVASWWARPARAARQSPCDWQPESTRAPTSAR